MLGTERVQTPGYDLQIRVSLIRRVKDLRLFDRHALIRVAVHNQPRD